MSYTNQYKFLDSGGGQRVESFADKILIRPSKTAVWSRKNLDFNGIRYDHKQGWSQLHDSSFVISCLDVLLNLQLLDNGQIGFFPEHCQYLEGVLKLSKTQATSTKKMLNLFGYTGLASIFFAKQGYSILHVDVVASINRWFENNCTLNDLEKSSYRYLTDDAVTILDKLIKKEEKFAVVVADPPSFSRFAKNRSWSIEEIFAGLVSKICEVLEPGGVGVITSHSPEFNCYLSGNLVIDYLKIPSSHLQYSQLLLTDLYQRNLLCGSCLVFKKDN